MFGVLPVAGDGAVSNERKEERGAIVLEGVPQVKGARRFLTSNVFLECYRYDTASLLFLIVIIGAVVGVCYKMGGILAEKSGGERMAKVSKCPEYSTTREKQKRATFHAVKNNNERMLSGG